MSTTLTATHLPTAISTIFGSPLYELYLILNRDRSIYGYKVLSDLIIGDSYFLDSEFFYPWEILYKYNANWGTIYNPRPQENIDVYKLFFEYKNYSSCPISDNDLSWYMKSINTSSYTRWCIAICKCLWKLIEHPSSDGLLCENILDYMRTTIYNENKDYLENYYSDKYSSKSKLKQYLSDKRLGVNK